jgi:hypothetical protein
MGFKELHLRSYYILTYLAKKWLLKFLEKLYQMGLVNRVASMIAQPVW